MSEVQPKKRKVRFVVKESKFCAGVKSRWRTPRGKHSKVRQQHRGRPVMPGPGYGGPRASYGLVDGKTPVLIRTVDDFERIDAKTIGVLSSTLGMRSKQNILKVAQEKKVTLLNADAVADLKSMAEELKQRKERREKLVATRKSKKEEKKEEKVAPQESSEEKVEEQKKAIEKTLTKRQ